MKSYLLRRSSSTVLVNGVAEASIPRDVSDIRLIKDSSVTGHAHRSTRYLHSTRLRSTRVIPKLLDTKLAAHQRAVPQDTLAIHLISSKAPGVCFNECYCTKRRYQNTTPWTVLRRNEQSMSRDAAQEYITLVCNSDDSRSNKNSLSCSCDTDHTRQSTARL
jgi:hypothetical protein